jgi:hypothetical protein
VAATTIDHVPPLIMFRQRYRPKGLEFPSCRSCNEGTKHGDLVAAMLSRVYPDAKTDKERDEFKKLLRSINNNIPGLLQEMCVGKAGQKLALYRVPVHVDGNFLRTDGPLVSSHMQTFATKLGFALFYELTNQIVPKGGGVAARWFSNYERLEGKFPQTIFDHLLPPETLRQGKFEVSDQFGYQWRMAEGDRMGMFFSYFRQAFAVVNFVTIDKSLLEVETNHPVGIISPGQITTLLSVS